ncbi:MAG: pilus assembly protein N-terminal domain-containing protein [Armatimonadetes bacterium]|nr:pilus assembly protein N-terminal domain-containing protein [Armatimonadota bacterium]
MTRPLGSCRKDIARAAAASALVVICAQVLGAAQALTLVPGGSRVLPFKEMRRVVLVDPAVADVVVASRSELVVFGKTVGVTKLYVWDARGRHEYAINVQGRPSTTLLVRRLNDLLPACLTVRALDEKTILLTGICASTMERERALEIAKKVAGDVRVVDVIGVVGDELTPAERVAAQLKLLFGPNYEYLVWGEKTVIVRGPMSPDTMQDLTKITEGLGGECKVVLVRAPYAGAAPPVMEIADAVGRDYKVWALPNGTVVVEGEAQSQAALDRVKGILGAFSDRAVIVNLVSLAPPRRVSAAACAELLTAALGEAFTVRVVGEDAIAIEGTVPTEDAYKKIADLTSVVAKDVRVINLVHVSAPEKRRVVIHVKVVDLNRDDLKRYGVDWGQIAGGEFRDQPIIFQLERVRNNVYPLGNLLHALEQENRAKILAEPNLVVNDGEEASVMVGGEIPIPIVQPGGAGGGGGFAAITIEYKPFGVNLRVKPEITETGLVKTKVEPEVSTVDYTKAVSYSGFLIPGLATRKASTTVTLAPGSTLVIAGLIREDEYVAVKQIPLLAKLPMIGELFRKRETSRVKTELVIFLSPEILAEGAEQVQAEK